MKITIEQTVYKEKIKSSAEIAFDDCDCSKMIDLFVGCMVSQTFAKESILRAMEDYIEGNKGE